MFNIGKVTESGVELFKVVYPDLLQPSATNAGLALGTVFDFANTILLPMKLVNEKSKVVFQRHMNRYKDKMELIPTEEVGTVPQEVGLPIMDELLKVTNDDLAELFINLLVNASTIENCKYAHPSFINVLKNLSSDEAKIINYMIYKEDSFAFISYARVDKNLDPVPLPGDYSNIPQVIDELEFPHNHQFYMVNLTKQGILERLNTYLHSQEWRYKALIEQYKTVFNSLQVTFQNLDESHPMKGSKIDVERGRFAITAYGKQFIKSIKPIN